MPRNNDWKLSAKLEEIFRYAQDDKAVGFSSYIKSSI